MGVFNLKRLRERVFGRKHRKGQIRKIERRETFLQDNYRELFELLGWTKPNHTFVRGDNLNNWLKIILGKLLMNNDFKSKYLDETSINLLITISAPVASGEGADIALSNYLDKELEAAIIDSNNTNSSELRYKRFIVNTHEEFFSVLENISNETRKERYYPGIHFDMHGGDKGLEIGATGEQIEWDQLLPVLREINKNVKNNLLVISSCCLSFEVIKSFYTFNEITPFNVLIAPEREVLFDFLENEFVRFFRELIKTEDIYKSYNIIKDEYGLYISPHAFMSLLTSEAIRDAISNTNIDVIDNIAIKQRIVSKIVLSKAKVFLAEKTTPDLFAYLEENITTALKL